jgi:polyphosphate kinase 2 (PPK2 family)
MTIRPHLGASAVSMSHLDALDLSQKLSREEQDSRLSAGGARLAQLRLALGGKVSAQAGPDAPQPRIGPPLCLVFEGWDASGKGGVIKRLIAPLDQRHVRVASFAAPTPDELRHHYLARFVPALPGWGGMTVFDRSWYGRVLVERVEALIRPAAWQRAYGEIAAFERSLVAEGAIVVKFWLHVSSEEQLRRFERREREPLKRWKLTDEDWRNRERRDDYAAAVQDMLEHTDRPEAPWVLVEAESKPFARVKVMESVIEHIERGCATRGFPLPDPL